MGYCHKKGFTIGVGSLRSLEDFRQGFHNSANCQAELSWAEIGTSSLKWRRWDGVAFSNYKCMISCFRCRLLWWDWEYKRCLATFVSLPMGSPNCHRYCNQTCQIATWVQGKLDSIAVSLFSNSQIQITVRPASLSNANLWNCHSNYNQTKDFNLT